MRHPGPGHAEQTGRLGALSTTRLQLGADDARCELVDGRRARGRLGCTPLATWTPGRFNPNAKDDPTALRPPPGQLPKPRRAGLQ